MARKLTHDKLWVFELRDKPKHVLFADEGVKKWMSFSELSLMYEGYNLIYFTSVDQARAFAQKWNADYPENEVQAIEIDITAIVLGVDDAQNA